MSKQSLILVPAVWATLIVERSRPDLFPAGSLFFPAVVTLLLWFRSAGGILIAGLLLLADWLIRPTAFPLTAAGLPLLATLLLTATTGTSQFSQRRRLLQRLPTWLWPAVLITLAVGGHEGLQLALQPDRDPAAIREAVRCLAIAVPLGTALGIISRTADNLGLRQRATGLRYR